MRYFRESSENMLRKALEALQIEKLCSMLRLPTFEDHAPKSIDEAVTLKAGHGNSAIYSAGQTNLFPNMKERHFSP